MRTQLTRLYGRRASKHSWRPTWTGVAACGLAQCLRYGDSVYDCVCRLAAILVRLSNLCFHSQDRIPIFPSTDGNVFVFAERSSLPDEFRPERDGQCSCECAWSEAEEVLPTVTLHCMFAAKGTV